MDGYTAYHHSKKTPPANTYRHARTVLGTIDYPRAMGKVNQIIIFLAHQSRNVPVYPKSPMREFFLALFSVLFDNTVS